MAVALSPWLRLVAVAAGLLAHAGYVVPASKLRDEEPPLAHIVVEVEPPHVPSSHPCGKMKDQTLEEGQVLVQIVKFVFRANELNYFFIGNTSVRTFQHFRVPPGVAQPERYGRPPVWGVGVVVASRCAGVPVGIRITRGYFPMSPYVVLTPTDVTRFGFLDGTPHRAESIPSYRYYENRTSPDMEERELDSQLFTGWVAALSAASDKPMAETLLVTSASSRTGRSTAFAAKFHKLGFTVVGLTSSRNAAYTRGLGVYSKVLLYDEILSLPKKPVAVVDVAGNRLVTKLLYSHLGSSILSFRRVGESHLYQRDKPQPSLHGFAGAAPQWFLAFDAAKSLAEAFGEEELGRRRDAVSKAFYASDSQMHGPVVRHYGVEATLDAIRTTLHGGLDPGSAHLCSLWPRGHEEPRLREEL